MSTTPDAVRFADDEAVMRRAVELAQRGRGLVEPNPMVGAVLIDDDRQLISEGFHERFGGPHAEVHVLQEAGERARGGTLFVTLEPCCHYGKTGPCSRAIVQAGVKRVVVGIVDPAPHVAGGGIADLVNAKIEVEIGVLAEECRHLIAPFTKLMTTRTPWVHAKWAMTLDGKLAAHTGHSQWISNETSRANAHQLRGLVDAVIVGAGTVRRDNPRLTARPSGRRTPVRVVVDTEATLSLDSNLIRTLDEAPVMVACGTNASLENIERLRSEGIKVVVSPPMSGNPGVDLASLLHDLGRQSMTHVLVEGGNRLLGSFFDAGFVDEVHIFVGPKIVGGDSAPHPVGGTGLPAIPELSSLIDPSIRILDGDVLIEGRLRKTLPMPRAQDSEGTKS